MPGLTTVAGPDAPVRLRLTPRLSAALPRPVTFGDGVSAPLVGLVLEGARVAVDVDVGEQLVTVVSFEADLALGLGVDVLDRGKLALRVDSVEIVGLRLPHDELFSEARLDVIAPFVVDLALGVLAARPITFEVGLDGLTSGLGVPVVPAVVAVQPAGVGADWLAVYIALADPPPPNALVVPPVRLVAARAGELVVDAALAPGERLELRAAGGPWSAPIVEGGRHVVALPRLWLVGTWPVEARLTSAAGALGPPWFVGWAEVAAP